MSAPSMVFGEDLVDNVQRLSKLVDHVEIVLFHTPRLHNFPSSREIDALLEIKAREKISFSVHLPTSLEIASTEREKREASVQLARELFLQMSILEPLYYILHIPFTPPTLVPVPGSYIAKDHSTQWGDWPQRALASLEILYGALDNRQKILVENINYSPCFLEPFLQSKFCELCLDLGHLMLGNEKVTDVLTRYIEVTPEIHLHGVKGHEEHVSLSALPRPLVTEWMQILHTAGFSGILNLEVFSPADLEESDTLVRETFFR
jgi:sugar phosphate isomerase/epimerase